MEECFLKVPETKAGRGWASFECLGGTQEESTPLQGDVYTKGSEMTKRLTKRDEIVIKTFIEKTFKKEPTAEELVFSAKSRLSPIHEYFEWDDKKAASEFRSKQAEELISVVIYLDLK